MSYTHNAEGKLFSVTYPTDINNTTPQYTYTYDAMMRANGMTDQIGSVVSNVLYGVANEMLSMTYDGGTETRTYNSMFQLTGISGLGQNISYYFPGGANNGKIGSQTDAISGETVTYAYDSLNRLTSASGSGWSQSYTYDEFGNLTNKGGVSIPVDSTTNRLSSPLYSYDANGNLLSVGNHYDAENRLTQVINAAQGGTMQYFYDAQNKRIWQGTFSNANDPQYLAAEAVSLFGADGQLAATYTPVPAWNNTQNQAAISFQVVAQRVYFGKKLIAWKDSGGLVHNAVQDRLGSVGKYYPYGEERNSPPISNDQVKFATYTRDSATGLDYADQRYYASTFGRFMSPDPYRATATSPSKPTSPLSWNRYAYVTGDPVNKSDPSGLTECYMDDDHGNLVDCNEYHPDEGEEEVQVMVPAGNSYTRNQMRDLQNGFNDALDHVEDPSTDCAQFFESGFDSGQDAINAAVDVLTNTTYRLVPLPQGPGAGAQVVGPTDVMINTDGAFFNATLNADRSVTVTLPNAAGVNTAVTFATKSVLDGFLLLHELGHQVKVLGPDVDAATNGMNSKAVLDNCFTKDAQGVYH